MSRGGAVKIEGDWKAEYTVLVPVSLSEFLSNYRLQFTESGWIRAFLSDIQVAVVAAVYPLDGRPQVKIGDCKADIAQLEIE